MAPEIPAQHEVANIHQSNGERLDELNTIYDKQSDLIQSLQKGTLQLANYFFVSQAVVFTALAGDSSLVCHDLWFPLVFTLLPGSINLYGLFLILRKYKKVIIYQQENVKEREQLAAGRAGQRISVDTALEKEVTVKIYTCMIACAFLTIVMAFGSFWMLCGEKTFVKHDDGAKCLKLCDGGKCIRICPKS
ncbi:hypothetical protein Vadar_007027 [Vaccinium darrowii]|nr:hypothetical protein Vadar_007027 [Vaccinium darrowii]